MPTNYDPTVPSIPNQNVPDAFTSTRLNALETDSCMARDHYPASESADNLRGTHKLLTFDKTSILTTHPATNANEYKLYLFQESPSGVVSLYTRMPNSAIPKNYPGFFDGTTIKTINSILANSNGNFTISGTTSHITVTASTNEILLDLDGKITDSLNQLVIDVDKHKVEILKLQGEVQTNSSDITTLKSGVATNTTDITNLSTRTTALETTTGIHTNQLATLETTVIKTVGSSDGSVVVTKPTQNAVNLSVQTVNPITLSPLLVSKEAGNAIRIGSDKLLYSQGSSFNPASLAGIGLGFNDPALNVKLGRSLETTQSSQGSIEIKLSKSSTNSLSILDDGLYAPSGGGPSAGVSSIDGLSGAVTTSGSGVVTKIVDQNNKQISFDVIDAVTQAKSLYYDPNKGDDANPAAGSRYAPLRTLAKCIELVKTTYVSSDIMSIICVGELSSLSYTGIPGVHIGDGIHKVSSDSTTVLHELNSQFWSYVYTNGRVPLSSLTCESCLGNTNFLFVLYPSDDQMVPSKNSFSFTCKTKVLNYTPAQTDYIINVRAAQQLAGKFCSTRSLYVRLDASEIVEAWQAGSSPLAFVHIGLEGITTNSENRIDVIFDINNESVLDLNTGGQINKVPFLSITGYDETVHQYLSVRIVGSTFGAGSKLWSIVSVDKNLASYNIQTDEFISCSQLVVPLSSIKQPPEPINGATRWNNSAGSDKTPSLEVFYTGQWRAAGGSGGSGNNDVVETIYYSSAGLNSNDGRQPDKGINDINLVTNKAISLRSDASHDTLDPVYIQAVGIEKNHQIQGNITSLVDGQIYYSLRTMNFDGLVITQTISNPITKRNTTKIVCNQIHNASHIIVNVDTTTATTQSDEFNLYIDCAKLEIDGTNATSFITVQKSSGTTGTNSVMKRLNLYLDVNNLEELAPTDVTATPLVNCVATGLTNLAVFVYCKNNSQDISGVTATNIIRSAPFVITGTIDAQNPVTLSTRIEVQENSSMLYDFGARTLYKQFYISLPDTLYTSSMQPSQLVVPTSSDSTVGSLSLNQDTLQYNNSFGVASQLATQTFVQSTIDQSLANMNASEQKQCATFPFYIKIDPVSQSIFTPNIHFYGAGQDYPELSSIDMDTFTIQEEFFTFRLNDLTQAGGTVLPKQLQLDQWTGTGNQSKAFYGVARIKLIDTTVTVTDDTSSTDDILYNMAFTSTLSLDELNKNLLAGLWIELSNATDNKYVTAVLASKVVAGSGSNNFVVKMNICFTNSKRQAELYTLADLANKALSIYLCPFPSVFAQEMKRFRSTVVDNGLCHVVQNYYIVGIQSTPVIEEALLLIAYSPSYKALSDSKTNPTWDRDVGKYGASIGNMVPKIIVEKCKQVWQEISVKIGYINMIIPAVCRDNSTSGRTLLGLIIQDTGSSYESTYLFSDIPTNPLYYNMPSVFNNLLNLSVVSTKIGCGLQLSSFIDGNAATVRISLNKDLDVRQTIDDQDVAGGIPSSFRSTTSSQAVVTRASVLDESVLKNIAVYSKPASKYRPFSNILTTAKAASGLIVYIAGFSMPNSLNTQNHKLFVMNEPMQPPVTPADDDILVLGNFTADELVNAKNKGGFVNSAGNLIGHLVNS